jgi:membrane protease YdiL (CAAX protease family)
MRRAGALYGASFVMMVVISLVFYAFKAPKGGINIPWLSVAISLFGVAAPAAIACYWPKEGAPGELPSFSAVNPWVLAGAGLFSLPHYILFAALQNNITKLLPFHLDASLVEPLTANGPLSFTWIWVAIALLPALTEEFLYRGVMQRAAVQRFGPAIGIALTACLFSLVHMELAGGLSRILMGLWFGYLFWRTGSLWTGILAHGLNNSWGVALANWHKVIEPNLTAVYGLAALCVAAGYACFHKAGFWPWQRSALDATVPKEDGPQLPHFVTMARPERPPTEP